MLPKIKFVSKILISLSLILFICFNLNWRNSLHIASNDVKISKNVIKIPETPLYLGVQLLGRLGNNMFQIASCIGLSHRLGRKATLILSGDMNSAIFDIFNPQLGHLVGSNNPDVTLVAKEVVPGALDENIWNNLGGKTNETYIRVGTYLQSWKYFKGVEGKVKQLFQFNHELQAGSDGVLQYVGAMLGRKSQMTSQNALELQFIVEKYLVFTHSVRGIMINHLLSTHFTNISLKLKQTFVSSISLNALNMTIPNISIHIDINFDEFTELWKNVIIGKNKLIAPKTEDNHISETMTFIGLHVRRGDFLNYPERLIASLKWIYQAMLYYERKYANCVFIVCSDDVTWCKNHLALLPFNSVVIQNRKPEEDMCLLSLCNHSIFTVGTFGWWSAWLAGGEAIYLKNYTFPDSWLDQEYLNSDYFLPRWIGL